MNDWLTDPRTIAALAAFALAALLALAYLTGWRERRMSQTLFDEQFRTDRYKSAEPLARRVKSSGKGQP